MNARKEEMKTGRMDVFIEARRNKKQQTCGRTYGRKAFLPIAVIWGHMMSRLMTMWMLMPLSMLLPPRADTAYRLLATIGSYFKKLCTVITRNQSECNAKCFCHKGSIPTRRTDVRTDRRTQLHKKANAPQQFIAILRIILVEIIVLYKGS